MNKEQIAEILSNPYNRDNWVDLLKKVFIKGQLKLVPQKLPINSDYVNTAYELGSFETADKRIIGVYEVNINDNVKLERNRVGLRNLLKPHYKQIDGAFAVYNQDSNWRFSFISEIKKRDEHGNWIEEKTEPKRYTYVLGKGETVRTAVDRFDELFRSDKQLVDIKEAFSVEKVTKEFFTKIAVLFSELTGGDRKIGSKVQSFKPLLKLPRTTDKKVLQEFSVRLIGRIVFCWFLNKKVSNNGVSLIPSELLSRDAVVKNKNYYHNILEQLFFEALNTKIEERKKEYQKEYYKDVPFLNGGLFEPNEDDFYNPSLINSLVVPDKWLLELFTILENFNFTIDENTSLDIELSVDPEMLGRIFENLLAEINPETGETARKATGSYYTPRAIVEYMVDESLKLFLKTKTEINEDKLSLLVSYSDEGTELTNSERIKILNAIDNAKILDPACGSGAYPIGILQKMLLVLQKIDPKSELWFKKMVDSIDDQTLKEQIRQKFKNENLNFIRKFGLIQKCVYGVDLQTIAVELSKLRCFLTLVVDEEIDDEKYNRGIIPLPNLEFKFVAANTLIGLEDMKQRQGSIFDESDYLITLEKLRDEYFAAYGKNKEFIELAFIKTQQEISNILEKQERYNKERSKRSIQLANWKPFSNESANWFDSKWMFGISNGFDIIIGNPPYGILNKRQNKTNSIVVSDDELFFYKNSSYYKPAAGGMLNIFRLFILKSIYLLSSDGVFIEIFPLAFTGDLSCANLREHILEHCEIVSIECFPERDNPQKRIFEPVKMSVCILNLINRPSKKDFFIRINNDRFVNENYEKNFINKDIIELFDDKSLVFPLVTSREKDVLIKMFKNSIKLSEICNCSTGEVDMTFCKEFFTKNKKDAVLLKGAIIDRYLLREKMSQGEIVYINEKKFLEYKKNINCNFKKNERIVLQGITGVNENIRIKGMIIKDAYCANSLNYLTLYNTEKLKYILGIINSKLINFVFKKFSTNSNVNGYEVDNLPIVMSDKSDMLRISQLVECVIEKKAKSSNRNAEKLEEQIDFLIYKLFKLNYDDIIVVDPEIQKKINRRDFEYVNNI
ncbi:MAG: hypothetical protein EHM58_00110 [Ignavibacteriae bacterium]|nr:MAG: hypothetical protein EHM58_00110 [Ignavibacteriota bacterium]